MSPLGGIKPPELIESEVYISLWSGWRFATLFMILSDTLCHFWWILVGLWVLPIDVSSHKKRLKLWRRLGALEDPWLNIGPQVLVKVLLFSGFVLGEPPQETSKNTSPEVFTQGSLPVFDSIPPPAHAASPVRWRPWLCWKVRGTASSRPADAPWVQTGARVPKQVPHLWAAVKPRIRNKHGNKTEFMYFEQGNWRETCKHVNVDFLWFLRILGNKMGWVEQKHSSRTHLE